MPDWKYNEIILEGEDNLEEAVYEFAGNCQECGIRTFVWVRGERSDTDVGERLAAFVATSPGEPATVYCQKHYLAANPEIAKHIADGIQAQQAEREKSAMQKILDQMTLAMGGR